MKKIKQKTCDTILIWDGKEESVSLNIDGKKVVPVKNLSMGYKTTENVFISADNYDALKYLQKDYSGKIRVIYIDPPYNTGHKFVYKDKYQDKFCRHSNWCNMIYARLVLAKNLLSENGVIFISIDGCEVYNLKLICDEIFGEENFITQFIYEKTQHFGRQKLNFYSNSDFILCYAKNKYNKNGKIKELLVENVHSDLLDAPLYNASNKKIKITFPAKTVKFNLKDGVYKKTSSSDYILHTVLKVKNGRNENDFVLEFKSRWSEKKVKEEIKKGTEFWVKTKMFAIRAVYSKHKLTKKAPKQIIVTNPLNCTLSRFGERVKTSESATSELNELLKTKENFSYPKSVSLISYLISLIYDEETQSFPNDFTVLDFFTGSGTTAHACMHLNSLDNGKRKFIIVQKPEKMNSNKYGTISELCRERLIKSCELYKFSDCDTGFKYYKTED